MIVDPYDTPLRYLVSSDSRPEEKHLADLGEGECSCEDWHFRKRKCKHLKAAEEYLLSVVIIKLKTLT